MKEIAQEFINIIENNGYKAYIVGGFVRDYIIGIESHDIDVTTNATPKDIGHIFTNIKLKKNIDENSYGSIQVIYKNIVFEVTTFRMELEYLDNRHPSSIKYIDDLKTDLQRRDFTINAICMDKDGNIIDPLNGSKDIKNKVIKTIINPNKSFKDDALRMLRAIRFSTTLNFKLYDDLINAIKSCKKYLKNISYERKKNELDKIFASKHAKRGIALLKALDLINILELTNIDKVKDYTDLIGIWSMINSNSYRFTRHEKELIKKVNIVYKLNNLDPNVLYKYGLYINILAGVNKGLNKKQITEVYNNLPIKTRSDILITSQDICKILNKEPGKFLNNIYTILEKEIINGNIKNKKEDLEELIKNI